MAITAVFGASTSARMQVTFTSRANLVIVPPSLAAQWEAELHTDCVGGVRVLVVADKDVRHECRTTIEGMTMCAARACPSCRRNAALHHTHACPY